MYETNDLWKQYQAKSFIYFDNYLIISETNSSYITLKYEIFNKDHVHLLKSTDFFVVQFKNNQKYTILLNKLYYFDKKKINTFYNKNHQWLTTLDWEFIYFMLEKNNFQIQSFQEYKLVFSFYRSFFGYKIELHSYFENTSHNHWLIASTLALNGLKPVSSFKINTMFVNYNEGWDVFIKEWLEEFCLDYLHVYPKQIFNLCKKYNIDVTAKKKKQEQELQKLQQQDLIKQKELDIWYNQHRYLVSDFSNSFDVI